MQDQIRLWIEEIRRYNTRLHLVSPVFLRDLEYHVLDCMELLEQVREPELADLGSGSGLPGIPYKIVHPDSRVTLIERSAGKSTFLQHVIDLLGLADIEVLQTDPLCARIGPYEAVISRAFSPQKNLEKALLRILVTNGRFYYIATLDQELNLGGSFRIDAAITKGTPGKHLVLNRYTLTSV
ncbi:MAG TPA: hypothetical protein ENN34_03260 [Deltaproteobacteria bacterium]|nr:hypothetical protein [Deltaproteobacteria bacterium]